MKLKVFISIVISVIIVFLGISMKGNHWLYLDNNWYPLTNSEYWNYITGFFYTLNKPTFFGFDDSVLSSSRFLGYFLQGVNDFSLYAIFLISTFIFAFILMNLFFSKKSSAIGALFYTINPISLYFLNLTGFIFAYTSLPIVLYSIYKILYSKKYIYILILLIGTHFLISYTRALGIYLLLILIIGAYYRSALISFIKNNKSFSFFLIIVILLYFSPFILSIIYPYLDGQKDYFKGLGNYVTSSSGWGKLLYNSINSRSFIENIIPREIISNFANSFQNTNLFIIYSVFFVFLIPILSFFQKNNKNYKLYLFNLGLFLLTLFIISGPKFMGEDLFIGISYKYFPFIANNTYWLHLITVPLIAFFLAYLFENIKTLKWRLSIIGMIAIYLYISVYPFLITNKKLELTNINDIPVSHKMEFWDLKEEERASLFYPGTNLLFTWANYPLVVKMNSYKELFSSNNRYVNEKQITLFSKINEFYTINSIIFNIKSIFLFKDLKNPTDGQFDFFPIKDYLTESENLYEIFINDPNLYTRNNNNNFIQFGLKDDDKYEFHLYSPGSIQRRDMESFFSEELPILEKPMVVDPDSFHKPSSIDTYEVPIENQNIEIRYKNSIDDTTKIYAKIANFDNTKPFLLQLNQTFGMSWKVKWITKEQFEEKPCIDEYREFSITQNKVCQFDATFLDLRDTKYLSVPQVSEERHFEGNFVGNTWLIRPDDIPNNMKDEKELYAIIIYEKQIWYAWTLVLAGVTFVILVLLSLWECVRDFRKKKN